MKKYFLGMALCGVVALQGTDVCTLVEVDLHKAAASVTEAGYFEACLGCKCNTNIDEKNANGETPLFTAILKRNAVVANLLMDVGADIHAVNNQNQTLLHCAAQSGELLVAERLLKSGLDINARDAKGQTPLHVAIAAEALGSADLLLSKGANPNLWDNEGSLVIDLALSENARDLLKQYHAKGCVDVSSLALHELALDGADVAQAEFILHCDPSTLDRQDENGKTPLMLAIANGNDAVANFLLDHGAAIYPYDAAGQTALWIAFTHHNTAMCTRLLNMGANVAGVVVDGLTLLHLEVMDNAMQDASLVGNLVSLGADVNAMSDSGTPLHCAVRANNEKAVEALLGLGADVNKLDNEGSSPLDYAENNAIRNLLVANGGKPSCAKCNFWTKWLGNCIPAFEKAEL